jgi:hypothetical protein
MVMDGGGVIQVRALDEDASGTQSLEFEAWALLASIEVGSLSVGGTKRCAEIILEPRAVAHGREVAVPQKRRDEPTG